MREGSQELHAPTERRPVHFETREDLIGLAERYARFAAEEEATIAMWHRYAQQGNDVDELHLAGARDEAARFREWEARYRRLAKAF